MKYDGYDLANLKQETGSKRNNPIISSSICFPFYTMHLKYRLKKGGMTYFHFP
jgi:hypothetical protein